MPLYCITGSAGKFRDLKDVIPNLEQLNLELDEIQSLEPQTVIEHKLVQAASHKSDAFIVEDTSLCLDVLGELPGPLIKWFLQTLGPDGITDLASRYENQLATARSTIGYRDSQGNHHYFVGENRGRLVKPRGTLDFGWGPIFQPEGETRTFGEMPLREKNRISMRSIAARKLAKYLSRS